MPHPIRGRVRLKAVAEAAERRRMRTLRSSLLVVLAAVVALSVVLPTMGAKAAAVHYYVSPSGSDDNDGRSVAEALETIQAALDRADPGSTIHLAAGSYRQDVHTTRNGTTDSPITIVGPPDAVVHGAGSTSIVEVTHDHHVLSGFTIDGRHSGDSVSGYRRKLLYAQGQEIRSGVTGLRVLGMTLTNALDECVRLRYFAQYNELAGNSITNCGLEDFRFGGSGKNGEGIYIGTAPEQAGDGRNPTADPDESTGNLVRDNRISGGGECIDIKEGAHSNVVEGNLCTGALDPNSGGIDSRGNDNVIRNNEVTGGRGAGVRLGGDTSADGIGNDVYENAIRDNMAGGIKFMARPQGTVCGNFMSGNAGGDAVGTYRSEFDPTATCPATPTSTTAPVASTTTTSAPATTTTGVPTTTLPPQQGARIEERFNRSPGPMVVVSGGAWRVKDGAYRLGRPGTDVDVGNSNIAVHPNFVSGDFHLTAIGWTEGTSNPFNDFSVLFGYVDPTHYCFVSFNESNDGNTSGVFRVDGSTVTEVADIATPITADRNYGVAITKVAAGVQVHLDGRQVASAAAGCGDGRVGFGTRNDAARFDDLILD